MNQYADYDYYQNEFCGTEIDDEKVFNRMAKQASSYLDRITFERTTTIEPDDEIKFVCCLLAEINFNEMNDNSEAHEIASESVGPHSISYFTKHKSTEEYESQRSQVCHMYLDSWLLYRGVK